MATAIQVLESSPVREAAAKALGGPVREVGASRVGETLIIEVHGQDTDAPRAAEVATTYARAYIDFRRAEGNEDLLAAGQQIQVRITQLDQELNDMGAQQGDAVDPRRDALLAQRALFRQRLDGLQIQAALKTGGAQLVAPAAVPTSPASPKPVRAGALAGTAGLLVGVGLVAVRELLDESIKTRDDLVQAHSGVPVLGLVPEVPGWRLDMDPTRLATAWETGAPFGEAYRSLRTSVRLLGAEVPPKTIQVTSSRADEGKTTTAVNLPGPWPVPTSRWPWSTATCGWARPTRRSACPTREA
ncbi:MAG: YveK family protein [Acidimicrobiales bacterium]